MFPFSGFFFFHTIGLVSRLFQTVVVGLRDSDFRHNSKHLLTSFCGTTEEKCFKLTWISPHIFSIDIRLIILMLFFFLFFFSPASYQLEIKGHTTFMDLLPSESYGQILHKLQPTGLQYNMSKKQSYDPVIGLVLWYCNPVTLKWGFYSGLQIKLWPSSCYTFC